MTTKMRRLRPSAPRGLGQEQEAEVVEGCFPAMSLVRSVHSLREKDWSPQKDVCSSSQRPQPVHLPQSIMALPSSTVRAYI
nr:uncharacterized protein LOC101135180 isoform X2 [Gorilla gorilla gorilla]